MGLNIRLATEADVGFLTDVAVLTLQHQGRWPARQNEVEYREGYTEWTLEQLRGEQPDSTLYVLDLDRAPVGRLRLVRSGDMVEIAGLQVLPAYQGRGIGTKAISVVSAEAHDAGLPLELGVEHDNPRARALYQRLGFREVGHDRDETRMRLESPAEAGSPPA